MAASLIMLSLLAMNALIGDSNSHMVALNDLAIVFINALAVVTLFYVAHHSDAQGSNAKWAWTLFGLSMLSCLVAGVGMTFADLVFHYPTLPPHGFFDILVTLSFLLFYLLAMAGFCFIPTVPLSRSEKIKIGLDTGMVTISSILFWMLLVSPGENYSSDASYFVKASSTIVPVMDVIFVFLILVVLLRRLAPPITAAFFLVAAIFSAAETVFGLRWAVGEPYAPFHPMHLSLAAGYLMVVLGGLSQIRQMPYNPAEDIGLLHPGKPDGESAEDEARGYLKITWPFYLPYLCAGAAYLLIVWDGYSPLTISHNALTLGVGSIIGLVIIRQIVALNENGALCILALKEVKERRRAESEVRRLNEDLEAKVEERTRELASANDDLCREIARRSEYEGLLEESEERLRAVFAAAKSVSFIITDADEVDLHIIEFSPGAEIAFGYKREEMIGRPLSILQMPDDVALYPRLYKSKSNASGSPGLSGAYALVRRSGQSFPALLSIYPLFDGTGEMYAVLAVSIDITEQKRAEESLKSSLDEKEVLLKEIHHRVKNNLQIIYSLLNIQAGKVQDESMVALIRECQNRIRSMALIHESLYRSENLAGVDLAQYIRRLTGFLLLSYGASKRKITATYELDDVRLTIDKAIPCGLMINELISNCLKHAFPGQRGGNVLITLGYLESGDVHLVISDDGIGMLESPDPLRTKSIGLTLLRALAKQLNATVDLDLSSGTEFRITFSAE